MISIARTAVARTDYRVRRRRYDTTPWLVRRNEWYELDEATDTVWQGCERELTLEQLARDVAARTRLPLNEALAATVFALVQFRELGMVELDVLET
jgi:hypothetical protein